MNAPFARHLVRFAAEASPYAPSPLGAPVPTVTLAVAELDAMIEEARVAARDEADAAHAAVLAATEDAQASALAEALSAARTEWCAGAAGDLAGLVEGAFVSLQADLANTLAKVLRPLLADAARERSCASLEAALARLLADPTHPAITLRAPADLVAALRARGLPAAVTLVVADAPEAVATCAGTRIETRLQAALADLSATEA